MSQFRSVHHLNDVDSIDRSLQAETFAFKCGKCGQSKTRYYQMQTRSADEPMTVCHFRLIRILLRPTNLDENSNLDLDIRDVSFGQNMFLSRY
jgi:hypothetical protein